MAATRVKSPGRETTSSGFLIREIPMSPLEEVPEKDLWNEGRAAEMDKARTVTQETELESQLCRAPRVGPSLFGPGFPPTGQAGGQGSRGSSFSPEGLSSCKAGLLLARASRGLSPTRAELGPGGR